MMEIKHKIPAIKYETVAIIPIGNHKILTIMPPIFLIKDTFLLPFNSTSRIISFPKGNALSFANCRHDFAIGIPMIVNAKKREIKSHKNADH